MCVMSVYLFIISLYIERLQKSSSHDVKDYLDCPEFQNPYLPDYFMFFRASLMASQLALASPRSMSVFSLKKTGLSTPA